MFVHPFLTKLNIIYFRDAIIVPIVNCGTSVFAGFAIFSVIGYMATELNLKVEDLADAGINNKNVKLR